MLVISPSFWFLISLNFQHHSSVKAPMILADEPLMGSQWMVSVVNSHGNCKAPKDRVGPDPFPKYPKWLGNGGIPTTTGSNWDDLPSSQPNWCEVMDAGSFLRFSGRLVQVFPYSNITCNKNRWGKHVKYTIHYIILNFRCSF